MSTFSDVFLYLCGPVDGQEDGVQADSVRKKKKLSQAPREGVESVKIEQLPAVPLLEPENYKTINQNCNFQLKDDSTLKSDG